MDQPRTTLNYETPPPKPTRSVGRLITLMLLPAVAVLGSALIIYRSSQSTPLPAARAPSLPVAPPFGAPSIGPRLHQMRRAAVWKTAQLPLGQTGFVAFVGPSVYQDRANGTPDYYTIDVERDGSIRFLRDLSIAELPEGFLTKPIGEIVSFDEQSRLVTFQIGDRKFCYQLPPP
jgi:hypothetical protein